MLAVESEHHFFGQALKAASSSKKHAEEESWENVLPQCARQRGCQKTEGGREVEDLLDKIDWVPEIATPARMS